MKKTFFAFLSCLLFVVVTTQALSKPLVIAHRSASGYLPEHTTEALVMAYMQGADYIEQDLVLSKDGELVVLHDIHLDTSTNVAALFPERKRQDNRYYAIDFTLNELKQLEVHERTNLEGQQVYPARFRGKAGFQIATLDEHVNIISELNRQFGKNTGWYIEIKAPQWHIEQGQDIAKALVHALEKHNLNRPDAAVYVQCFDFNHTRRLRNQLGLKTALVQLIAENSWGESSTDYDYLKTSDGLKEIKKIADGIGPWIPQLLIKKDNQYVSSGYVEMAHKAGLVVHPYTYRDDQIPPELSSEQILKLLFEQLKVDGIFTDFPDTVIHYLGQQK